MKLTKLTTSIAASLAMIASAFTPVAAQAQPLPLCTINIPYSNISFTGTGGGDVICLRGNNITIDTLAGDDTVIDYGDNNHVILGDGFDRYEGGYGSGGDVDGGAGDDYLVGSVQPDDFDGGAGDDTLIGAAGDDSLNGGLGADDLSGNAGADAISGEVGSDILDGGDGTDSIDGGEGGDTLVGGAGDDTLNGGLGSDDLFGGAGADAISGDSGADSLDGGDGADLINGGEGDDSLVGGAADDTLNGGLGSDQLTGEIGNDSLMGESGTDSLFGGDGDDIMAGGQDVDTLLGGAGLNVCDYDTGEALTATCKYDDSAPELISLSFSHTHLDSTDQDNRLRISISTKDQIGLARAQVTCSYSEGSENYVAVDALFTTFSSKDNFSDAPLSSFERIGTDSNLSLSAGYKILKGAYPGSYTCRVILRDKANREVNLPTEFGFSITRSGTGWDDVAPVPEVFEFSSSIVDTSAPMNKTELHLVLKDETDIGWGYVTCSDTKGNRVVELIYNTESMFNYKSGRYTSPTSKQGKQIEYLVPLEIVAGQAPGVYKCWISTRDSLHHQKTYNDKVTLTVEDSAAQADQTAPALISKSFSHTSFDVGQEAATGTLTFHLKDKSALGWSYLNCEFYKDGKLHRILGSGVEPNRFYDYDRGWVKGATFEGSSEDMVFSIPVTVPLGAYPGSYECWIGATDKFANGERFTLATFDVFRTPAGQPSSPTSLRFDASTPTDGILSWLPPETLGDPALVGYVLEYSVDGLSWQALPKSGTKVTSIDLSELKADTDYWFRVRGENGGTVGQDTSFMKLMWATLQVRTPKPIVADAPTGLLVSDVTSNSYKLAWTKPSSSGGSAITDFNVEVSSDSGKSWKSAKQIVSTSSSIVVTGAAPGTQYLVRVSAINGVGQSAFLTGSLTTLVAKPSSPRTLTSSKVTATALTLSWLLPASNGGAAITDYKVEVSSNGGTSWAVINDGVSNSLAATVSSLLKNRAYLFRVSAINSAGAGDTTPSYSVTTLATAPSTPISLTVRDLQATSVLLGWDAPSDFGGLNLTDYKVETSRDGKTWSVVPKTASTSRTLKLTGLAPGTQYLVRVSAINGVGQSAFLTGSLTTLAAKPSSPRTLTSSKVTATALTLSWLLPASNGGAAITDYKVEVSSNGGTSWAVINDGVSNSLAATVSSLLKNRAYLFRVSAINSAGAGDTTPSYSVTTLATAPSTPISLTVRDLQATSVLLGWDAPSDFGGLNLTDYKVETSRDGKTWSVVPKTASTSRTLKLTGLAPGTQYLVRVSALNVAGSSEHLTGTLTTLATTPSVPRNIVVTAISTNAATLNWQLPSSNGGSAISDYTVEIASNCTTYSLLNDGVSNTLYVKLSSLKPGLTYCVRVSAVNSVGTSETTPELQVKTLDYKPSAPKELAVKTTSTSVVLSWGSASVGAGSSVIDYVVEFSSNGGGTWIAIKKTKSSKTSLTVSGLKSKRTYLFRVLAVNLAGTSPASKTLKVTTK